MRRVVPVKPRSATPHERARFKHVHRCDDCASKVTIDTLGVLPDGRYVGEFNVEHSDCCPWLDRASGGRPFTVLHADRQLLRDVLTALLTNDDDNGGSTK